MSKRQPGFKEYKYLYQKMLSEDLIREAYRKLRKGKTRRREIQHIDAHLDDEVRLMREMILNTKPPGVEVPNPELAYRPHKRTPTVIFEHGKYRKIYMPEIHEQWLHHIIVLVLEPIIMATAYRFSCGSFPQRGAHYGKRRIERWLRNKPKETRNFAKIDIRHFYDSIRLDVLMRELKIRIKDSWFLYIIWLCLKGFKKGIPLGFYISQWLANYLLEPVDRMIAKLGITLDVRYMDDITMFHQNKKTLHAAVVAIAKMLGRRFRLKLKRTWQVCKFWYEGKRKVIGRPLDFMGFVFYRHKTIVRKRIMIKATRMARKLERAAISGKPFFRKRISAMLSYMGWFSCTNTYNCYLQHIKPRVEIRKLKHIISKLQRRQNQNDGMDKGILLGAPG